MSFFLPRIPTYLASFTVQQNSTHPGDTIRITNYPERLGPSGKFVQNSTKLTCPEITGYRIKYSTVYFYRTNFNAHFNTNMYFTLSSTCFGP